MRLLLTGSVVMLCTIGAASSYSAPQPGDDTTGTSWALEVRVERNLFELDFTGDAGTTVSLKYFPRARFGWRLGLTAARTGRLPNLGIAEAPWEFAGRIHALFFSRDRRQSEVRAYAGGGPGVRYVVYKALGIDRARGSDYAYDRTVVGLDALTGIEWSPVEWCGLSAEYRMSIEYGSESYRFTDRFFGTIAYVEVTEEQSWRLRPWAVVINLSVYF